MSTPSLNEWKKDNPNKGLNDYFEAYPDLKRKPQQQYNAPQTYTPPKHSFPTQTIVVPSKKAKKQTEIVPMVVSIMLIGAFFLAWINIDLKRLGVLNSTGFELPDILMNLETGQHTSLWYILYLIPFGAVFAFFGAAFGSWMKVIGEVIAILATVVWLFLLKQLFMETGLEIGFFTEAWRFFGIGLYLTLAGIVFYVYDMLLELF